MDRGLGEIVRADPSDGPAILVMAELDNNAKPMTTAARLTGVFSSPGEVFADMRERRVIMSTWLTGLLLIVAIGAVAAGVIFSDPAVQQEIRELGDQQLDQMEAEGKLTAEARERADAARDQMGPGLQIISGTVSAAVASGVWVFLMALAIKLLAWFGFSRRVAYMKAVEVAGVAGMISALEAVVRMLLVLIMGSLYAGPGLNLVVNDFDRSNRLHEFLASVNFLTLWYLLVVAVAVATLCESSFWKSATWVLGLWFGVRWLVILV